MKNDGRKYIKIRGASEHNLKSIDVDIPRNEFVVLTGLSGSGKSSLAFDTIYAEGQRRYMESLSSYARQFLGGVEKPDVESIEGLSPAIAIDQKSQSHNPRSTVATVTEIYDYLRLLYSRIGVPYCPTHNEPIIAFSVQKITDIIFTHEENSKIIIMSPIVKKKKGTHKDTLDKIKKNGFVRLRIDGQNYLIDEVPELIKKQRHDIDIVVDRIVLKKENRVRVFEAIELASEWSNGFVLVSINGEEKLFSEHYACPKCGFTVPKLEPRLFSFNSPLGACPSCNGLGINQECDIDLLVPDKKLSIDKGAILYYKSTVNSENLDWQDFKTLLDYYKIPTNIPFNKYTPEQIDILMNGSTALVSYELES